MPQLRGIHYPKTSKNYLINGGISLFQQLGGAATSVSHNQFNSDRWRWTSSSGGGSGGLGSLTSTDTPNSLTPNSMNTSLWTGSGSADTWRYLSQWIELSQYAELRGQKVTFGVWVKSASGAGGSFHMGFYHESSGTASVATDLQATPANYTSQLITPANSGWNFYQLTITLPANSTRVAVWLGAKGLSNNNIIWVVSQARLNLGPAVADFEYAGGSIEGEISACQRYSLRIGTGGGTQVGVGQARGITSNRSVHPLPVSMRTAPTLATTGTPGVLNAGGSAQATTGNTYFSSDGHTIAISQTVAAGLVAGNATTIEFGANDFYFLNAEI